MSTSAIQTYRYQDQLPSAHPTVFELETIRLDTSCFKIVPPVAFRRWGNSILSKAIKIEFTVRLQTAPRIFAAFFLKSTLVRLAGAFVHSTARSPALSLHYQ